MSIVRAMIAKHGRGFLAADEKGEQLHKRMEPGECAIVKVIRPRSLKWHKMYFGVCREIGANQDPPRVEESIDAEVRVLAGHFDAIPCAEFEIRVPRRIAFDQLTADEWAELWPGLEQAIRERFGCEYFWADKW